MKTVPQSYAIDNVVDASAPPDVEFKVKLVVVSPDDECTYAEVNLTGNVHVSVNVDYETISSPAVESAVAVYSSPKYIITCTGVNLQRFWQKA